MSISDLSRQLRELGAKKSGGGWIARCPSHEDRSPSLKIDVSPEGRLLVKCFAGCDGAEVLRTLRDHGVSAEGISYANRAKRVGPSEVERSMKARELWRASSPATGTVVESYLRSRGITAEVPATLRFVPELNHTEASQSFPVMLAAVTKWPSKQVVAVQRTYLRRDGSGKAPVEKAKKALGPIKGAAVRLAAVGERLGLSEGIEDALSAMQADPALPCWAVLGAEGFRSVLLPPLPLAREIVLIADRDAAGLKAANDAAIRFTNEGRRVRIALPPDGAKDFNEALKLESQVTL